MEHPPLTAFVLGAGLGTRLKSLTAKRPKPLIPVCNEPLITRAFEHLHGAGVSNFVVNTHWQSEVYQSFFPSNSWKDCRITFSHETPEVLETAGGLKHAENLLPRDSPFWVYNGDILADLPLQKALDTHLKSGNEATLVLRSKGGPLQVSFEERSGKIRDLGRRLLPAEEPSFLFTGIYLLNPAFLSRIPSNTKLSVVPLFIDMIHEGAQIGGVVIDEGTWWDLGSREQILAVHSSLAHDSKMSAPWVGVGAQIDPTAKLLGACAVGAHSKIGAGAILENCIIWENAEIAANSNLRDCIVTSGARVCGEHLNADLS
jgi:NDP-sugar pyrophosphorylase family protein